MKCKIDVTLTRDPIRGTWRASWISADGYLVQRTYYYHTKREALRSARAEAAIS